LNTNLETINIKLKDYQKSNWSRCINQDFELH